MHEPRQGTDLDKRHRSPEIMDAPDLPAARLIETLKGLRRVNTVTQSSRLMWPDLLAAARRIPGKGLRVLDVACGGGDVLMELSRWAAKASLDVEFAGCDASPDAVAYARDTAASSGAPIEFFVLKVGRDPLPEGYDMIMSTLFLHHLDEDDAIAFLREAAAKAHDRLVIQDLLRSRLSYWFARLGTRLLLLNDICRIDGRSSVEGAFTRAEAEGLAKAAGLEDAEIVPRFPFRYLIRWVRPDRP
ncbi:methyltransferase domain-containing protein [Methyloceanibacter sp.]|uniref:methyltransferase domain-containing protein n=1 Tax=Methyloceanibacter sp. TaxID=1965321 RepID=UPI002D53409E|nr:methyltransferase domain-containing protein [Methyloceanibacter sp.]HZP10253.1 methyltransferase domain-containing protein [Methyloceanibacter sp.]